jgi:hypothetical protein
MEVQFEAKHVVAGVLVSWRVDTPLENCGGRLLQGYPRKDVTTLIRVR